MINKKQRCYANVNVYSVIGNKKPPDPEVETGGWL